jgi:polynucleotide 5'-kinase involved in rRNA processing
MYFTTNKDTAAIHKTIQNNDLLQLLALATVPSVAERSMSDRKELRMRKSKQTISKSNQPILWGQVE